MNTSASRSFLLVLLFGTSAIAADRIPDPRSHTAPTEVLSEQEMQILLQAIDGCDLSQLSVSCKAKVSIFREDLERKRKKQKLERDEKPRKTGQDAKGDKS